MLTQPATFINPYGEGIFFLIFNPYTCKLAPRHQAHYYKV